MTKNEYIANLEKWIAQNNQYGKEHHCKNCSNNVWNQCQTNPVDCERYKELTNLKEGWAEGARAMYKHLQCQQPSEEQIRMVLQYVYDNLVDEEYIQDMSVLIDDMYNHWNND